MHARIEELVRRYPALETCGGELQRAFEALRTCYRAGNKVLLCGNGGSAADAEHWAGELMKGFERRRPLSAEDKEGLAPEIGEKLQRGLPAIPLTGFPSLRTAFANDVDPLLEFAQLLFTLGRQGDVLIALSTSGNAANVGAAVEVARTRGIYSIGFTGLTGGKLLPRVDLCIRVPATRTFHVQELHLPIYHALSLALEDEFFGNGP